MLVYYGINNITPLICKNNTKNFMFVTTMGGEHFKQYTSISLREFSDFNFSEIHKLIICSMFVEEIFNSLCQINFPIEKIFFYNCTTCTIESIESVNPDDNEQEFLLAVYDLNTNLASYDVINFLVLAEHKRISLKKMFIKFIIVPSRSNKKHYIANLHHKNNDLDWRISHIITPLAKAIPSIKSIYNLAYREEFNYLPQCTDIFPEGYTIDKPNHQFSYSNSKLKSLGVFKVFTPAIVAIEIVKNYFSSIPINSRVVTITLREYEKQPERNSNISSTLKFCNYLELNGFYPIIIRDTYTCTKSINVEIEKFCRFPTASIDLDIRLALYQASFLNISVNTGPCYLFYFTKGVNSIEYRWVDETVFSISKKTMEQAGYIQNKQPLFACSKNTVFWGRDSFENLIKGFLNFGESNA